MKSLDGGYYAYCRGCWGCGFWVVITLINSVSCLIMLLTIVRMSCISGVWIGMFFGLTVSAYDVCGLWL